MEKGSLIALEGIDGSGTTTHLRHLAEAARKAGHTVHCTAEPSSGLIGRLIRKVLHGDEPMSEQTLALLFAADRLAHWRNEIEPQLTRGAMVLCDRYLLSSLAYQASALPLDWVRAINGRAPKPAASILLRVSVGVAVERRARRASKPERFDADEQQHRVARCYDAVFDLPDVGPTYIVDGERPVDEVATDLAELVLPLLAKT